MERSPYKTLTFNKDRTPNTQDLFASADVLLKNQGWDRGIGFITRAVLANLTEEDAVILNTGNDKDCWQRFFGLVKVVEVRTDELPERTIVKIVPSSYGTLVDVENSPEEPEGRKSHYETWATTS